VALLAIVVAATVAGFVLRKHAGEGAAARAGYVCPMHPAVTSALPGTCPICGMALAPWREMSVDRAPPEASNGGARELEYELTMVRTRAAAREGRAPAWIESPRVVVALLYRDEIRSLSPTARLAFTPTASPRDAISVHPAEQPPQPWDASTFRVELRMDDDAPAARVGDAGWLKLPAGAPPVLVVPDAAIVRAPEGPYVFVADSDGRTFSPRPVRVGRGFFSASAIESGLAAGERVVVSNAFFLDAEQRLRARAPEGRRSEP
jgi:hypothetical protein